MSRNPKTRDVEDAESGVVVIHTDGACSGNPGPGGWGAILDWNGKRKEIKGGEPATTNNRMELTAAIMALESLKRPCRVRLVTDSNYVKDGLTKWLPGWKKNGWKTKDKKSVKNAELWTRLDAAAARHEIEWEWVKGHSGHPENERADELAREGLLEARIAHKVAEIKEAAILDHAAPAAPKRTAAGAAGAGRRKRRT